MSRSNGVSKIKQGAWVVLYWADAYVHDAGWINQDDISDEVHGIKPCISAGKVVKKDSKQVIIAATVGAGSDDKDVGNLFAIPLGWITKVEVIKESEDVE